MLDWIENTAIARMVQESVWGYPVILSSHAVGMAILVGIVLMINIRVLGFARDVPLASLKFMFYVALGGFFLNIVSGSMLFMANAHGFYNSNPFRIKAALLITGAILLLFLARRIFRSTADSAHEPVTGVSQYMAAVSIFVWLGVIVAGRLIAYVDVDY